jgi:hypothetical protein
MKKAESSGKSFYVYFLLIVTIYRKNKGAIFIYKLDPKEKDGNKREI